MVSGVNQESQTNREKLYEGLDAAHTPRLIVPEIYVAKRSNRLQTLAAWALLSSHTSPNTQFDVVWTGNKVSRLLRAEIQPTGTYNHNFGYGVDESDDYFLLDPSVIESSTRHFTYIGRVEAALNNGAGIFEPADLGRDFEK